VTPKGPDWTRDPAFRTLFDQEMSREIKGAIEARILAVNTGANPAKVAGSFQVQPTGAGNYEVIKRGDLEIFGTIEIAPTERAARGVDLPRRSLPGEDPIRLGIDDAMRQTPQVMSRVIDLIRQRGGEMPRAESLQAISAPPEASPGR
jgi:hypothetical protein